MEQRKHDEDTERIRQEWSIELKKHDEDMKRYEEDMKRYDEDMERYDEDMKGHEVARKRAKAEEREWWEQKQKREREEEQRWQEKKQRREREEAERVEREKWERQRMRLYWDDIQAEKRCIAYGTRKYSARLANLLPGIDAIEACKATPLTIHGVTPDTPDYCENVSLSPASFVSNLRIPHTDIRVSFLAFKGIGRSRIQCARPFGVSFMTRLVDSSRCLFTRRFIAISSTGLRCLRFRVTCMA
jgi:hypothetical protein